MVEVSKAMKRKNNQLEIYVVRKVKAWLQYCSERANSECTLWDQSITSVWKAKSCW